MTGEPEPSELDMLREENAELKMEIAYLKSEIRDYQMRAVERGQGFE